MEQCSPASCPLQIIFEDVSVAEALATYVFGRTFLAESSESWGVIEDVH